jgi:VanZ family protein
VAVWAGLIWFSSPLLPALRNYLNENAAGGFNRYVALGLLAAAAAVFFSTWFFARGGRASALLRLSFLAAGFALLYALLAAPDPRSHLVEAAHFAEYGTLAVLAFFSLRALSPAARWAQTLLLVVAVGLVDEVIQWALATRFAEIRDVALNAAAGGFGLVKATRAELRQIAGVAALLLPALGAFVYVVHFGHWIRWDEVEFVSRYRAEELERVGEDRRSRWASLSATERNGLLRPAEDLWAIEDFYVTEARRHIQSRNRAAEQGDNHAATGENRIVERWYTPYLDIADARRDDLPLGLTGTYRSGVPAHLWPWLESPRVWGALIAAEITLVGAVLRLGSDV